MADTLIVKDIYKSYGLGEAKATVLKGISFTLHEGEMTAIIGQSGSGKSTLLNLIGVLDRPDSGTIHFKSQNLFELDGKGLANFRNSNLGFVFQFHHLLPEFSAIENVLMPYRILHGRDDIASRKRALDLLTQVGVADRANNRANNLSGGQQQRVAIARALMNEPSIILADEPTGNLDSDSGMQVLNLLRKINREKGSSFIIVTHDRHIASQCDRVIEIADGRITNDIAVSERTDEENWNKLSPCYCRLRNKEQF